MRAVLENVRRIPKLINITALVLAIFWANFFWLCWSPFPPYLLWGVSVVTTLSLVVLFFANLFAVFGRTQKVSHAAMSLLIAMTILGDIPLFRWIDPGHRWFYRRGGYQELQSKVDKVLQRKERLSSHGSDLADIVGQRHVGGIRNPDGSVLIWFDFRGGGRQLGYLYYSGDQMRPEPGKTNMFFLPETSFQSYRYLTNCWYEW
jgi:hypothetical protein